MQLDDRLATVLRFDASSDNARRTQYRQLLDLLGRRKQVASRQLLAQAYNRLSELVKTMPRSEQAAIIRDPGLRLRNPLLIAALSETEPQISAAALSSAELSASDWESILTHIPVRARGMIRIRDDLPPEVTDMLDRIGVHDRGLPEPEGGKRANSAAETVIEMGTTGTPQDLANDLAGASVMVAANDAAEDADAAENNVEHMQGRPRKAQNKRGQMQRDPSPAVTRGGSRNSATAGKQSDVATLPANGLAKGGSAASSAGAPAPTRPGSRDQFARDDQDISALVERIATYQHSRSTPHSPDAPPLPLDERFQAQPIPPINGFSFSSNAAGQVDWAEPDVMPMVYGLRLFDNAPASVRRSVSRQRPIRAELIGLQGARAIAGDWVLDAAPRFTQSGGRFFGYAGRLRRPAPDELNALVGAIAAGEESDRVRQLLHELRTPVNAIQGFAEVIQQQLFGPASHEYRALAANIASDAARMLAGFDEMDRLAKLETGAEELGSGSSDLAEIMRSLLDQLKDVLAARSAAIDADIPAMEAPIGLEESAAQSLAWRLLATLAGAMGAGETCKLRMAIGIDKAQIEAKLPEALAAQDDIFAVGGRQPSGALSSGVFGAGFALRLVRAEIQALGGSCTRNKNWLVVVAPLLTDSDRTNSNEGQLHNVG